MTRVLRPLALLLAGALAAPAAAQESVSPEAFLALAQGKTLTFVDVDTGLVVGIEHFLSARRTVWTRPDGTCAYGTVSVRGPEVCFVYDDDPVDRGPHCWWPLREGLDLYVRLADAEIEQTQQITEIDDEPLSCDAVPSV